MSSSKRDMTLRAATNAGLTWSTVLFSYGWVPSHVAASNPLANQRAKETLRLEGAGAIVGHDGLAFEVRP